MWIFNKYRLLIKVFLKEFSRKFIIFSDRFINLYLYFIVFACILSWVPNINPNYPLFNLIFKISGFYLLPPFMGFTVAPIVIMMVLALLSIGLHKIYKKLFTLDPSKFIVLTKEDFERELEKFNKMKDDYKFEDLFENSGNNSVENLNAEKKEDNNDDCR